ncbi:GPN-loop GTPase 3 [Iris pallida]|uniref:GPN-loop GTPase 3 n=1 Tax=Iris pallida TaxID=29817 RepID=A0AAX6EIN0_IRIPA|nr:GPN-loop GTPase 3 [Iris pallida]KAJ6839857.1 GPN-loop GTPase 3 [Iris pallida]
MLWTKLSWNCQIYLFLPKPEPDRTKTWVKNSEQEKDAPHKVSHINMCKRIFGESKDNRERKDASYKVSHVNMCLDVNL